MKKMEFIPRSIEGDWDWRQTCANQPEGWITLQNKPEGEHIWSFIGNGTMISTEKGQLWYVVEYRYDPDLLYLSLNGWLLDSRAKREMLVREESRVEFPGPSEMYLYDLEDVEPGEEELLRLTLCKVPR